MTDETPFDQWSADLHAICGAYDGVPQRGQARVRGRIAVHAFDGLDVADVSGDVAGIERDQKGIRRDEAEHVFFLISVGGTMGVRIRATRRGWAKAAACSWTARAHGNPADLAFRAGFRDLSDFNRGLRASFGLSLRARHRSSRDAAQVPDVVQESENRRRFRGRLTRKGAPPGPARPS